MSENNLYTNEFYLTAADVTPWCEMPLSRLVTLIIDTATDHANLLGVGFARLRESNSSWVLSRLSIDLPGGAPAVNRAYRLHTWVVSLNRLYSERLFRLEDAATGQTIGWAHTTWMAIDLDTRRPVDLTMLSALADVINPLPFEGEPAGRLLPLKDTPEAQLDTTFRVTDIDVNRHVTTRRYVDLILDLWPLEWYMGHAVSRFEIAFKHEARYGDTALTLRAPHAGGGTPLTWDTVTAVGDTPCNLARIRFIPRENTIN